MVEWKVTNSLNPMENLAVGLYPLSSTSTQTWQIYWPHLNGLKINNS